MPRPHPLFGKPNFDPVSANFENSIIPRLWLGTSTERQKEMDDRAPYLSFLAAMGFQTFFSMEPLLEGVSVPLHYFADAQRKPWVIVGGESGHQARIMDPRWPRAIRDQVIDAGWPFFFKQWGEWAPHYYRDDGEPKRSSDLNGARVFHVGKARAGNILDNAQHLAFPEAP